MAYSEPLHPERVYVKVDPDFDGQLYGRLQGVKMINLICGYVQRAYIYMFPVLLTAQQKNNRAVWEAYGKAWDITSESDCVAELMKLYKKLTENNEYIFSKGLLH